MIRALLAELGVLHRVYVDDGTGHAPETTVRIAKGEPVPAVGERIVLADRRSARFGRAPTAECEAVVEAVAVVARPDWSTFRNPSTSAMQEGFDL